MFRYPSPSTDVNETVSPVRANPAPWMRVPSLLNSVSFWCAFCVLWAGLLAWATRHEMNSDGMSYLDLASAALADGPQQLISGYWSPGYPALLALGFLLLQPSPVMEFPLVHLVNLVIFALVLCTFVFFLSGWNQTRLGRHANAGKAATYITPLWFGLFLWFSTE